MQCGCQYIGPEQDPLRDYPIKYCGAKTVEGRSYCHEHYWRVYARGTSINGRRREKEIERELEELKAAQDLDEEELEDV